MTEAGAPQTLFREILGRIMRLRLVVIAVVIGNGKGPPENLDF
jgi:hypothetical protein